MTIKAIRMFDGGFMNQPFAFGGEEGKDAFDEQIIYRSSLQNFLIDTGKEVILVDTGFKPEFPVPAKKLGAPLFMGEKVADYMDARVLSQSYDMDCQMRVSIRKGLLEELKTRLKKAISPF